MLVSINTKSFALTFLQDFPEIIDGSVLFGEFERGCIVYESVDGRRFSRHDFYHHGDRHAGREPVRIEYDVGNDTGFCEWHVLRRPLLRTDSLLTGPAGKFVPDTGISLKEFDPRFRKVIFFVGTT